MDQEKYHLKFGFAFFFKFTYIIVSWASQVVLLVKNLPANAGDERDMVSIPGLGRFPEGGHGSPL